ncbi:hypothetical protein BJ973_001708 [Actinoplanes tereljensis]|uniref:DUF4062 domain-containing protein n=1 Tax=Paractinoplanes tereljensis TaxID=571912 RepID=A0A919NM71_9ACTN|nr:DUF4062 domain-containing protein [Actinoplanes tereljensis]GIF20387.1 hypothetical protein Ate02nite_31170 [Actinoplanes tereljensis]
MPSTEPLTSRPIAAAHDRPRRPRVYVSSAALDLAPARARVVEVIRSSGYEAVSMETYGADSRPPIERCLADVGTCEVYVGIVAWRYGSTPPGSAKSFTHLEYDEAVRLRKQVLLFHLDEQASWPTVHVDRSQGEVRRLRKIQARDHIVDHFADVDQLGGGVRRALHRLFGESTAPVPNLLPFIANRHAQRDELARAARGERLELSPSVVVVHGAAEQSHHKFAEFMQEQLLGRFLRAAGPVHMFGIPLRAAELDQPDVITRRIAGSCSLDVDADVDTLARRLHELGSLTMLRFPVEVEMRRGRPDVTQVDQLIRYFEVWPHRRPLRVLPVISAQYRLPSGWAAHLPWSGSAADRLAAAIGEVAGAAVVLPQLGNVEMVEVEVWAELPEVRRLLGGTDPLPTIRKIFQEYEQSTRERGMPMEKLAAKLGELLRSGAA